VVLLADLLSRMPPPAVHMLLQRVGLPEPTILLLLLLLRPSPLPCFWR
jgi:hypothetical protein